MGADSYVVGYDTATKAEAFIEDATVGYWRSKSYRRGNETLVCLHCFRGFEAPVGTRVPLVVKHREGGYVRAHFAHPPYMAPAGGHHPETVWHAEGKHVIAGWARREPGVVSAELERFIDGRERRADVEIRFTSGARMAVELQSRLLHDDDWVARHASYTDAGIVDVWLWGPLLKMPWIVARESQPIYFFDTAKRALSIVFGAPHAQRPDWDEGADLSIYVPHPPAHIGDTVERYRWKLDDFSINDNGLQLPTAGNTWLRRELGKITDLADRGCLIRIPATCGQSFRLNGCNLKKFFRTRTRFTGEL